MTKKIFAAVLAIMLILTAFAGCTDTTVNEETTTDNENVAEEVISNAATTDIINVSLLKGPTGMGGAYMWEKSDNGETSNKYNITLDTDATTVGPKLMQGEYDIAAVPTNLAAALYQKSQGKVKVIAVNTLGVLYIVTKDGAVSSVADLKGKTILASGQGTIAEYALNYVLESNNLVIGTDVTIEFATEHAESVTKALTGGYDAVLLPEPFVSQIITKDNSFSVAINITKEWEKTGDCTLAMGCIAVNAKFYEENKEAVRSFLTDYSESVNYINENIENAATLIEKHNIMPAAVAKKAIPNANIVCYTGTDMKQALSSCYNVLFNQNAKIIGGQMPGDDFYVDTNS
ncbi:MAG: PhnD/SsuA/transferrin family substrate-binding protein [Clostridia bacterium]|nr:PhnD/SsuA/transferrin family substrate-binding protein [Clostridia bacterium]